MSPANGLDLITAIEAAGQEEIDAIDERLSDLNGRINTLKQSVDRLHQLRRIICGKPNGKPLPAIAVATDDPAPAEPTASAQDENWAVRDLVRNQVFDLLTENGSMPVPAIAASIGKQVPYVAKVVRECEWFERRDGEVHIAKAKQQSCVTHKPTGA